MAAVSEPGGSRWTPRLLLMLIERFPEGSEFNAELMGDRQFRDWTLARYLDAGIINAVNSNTIVSGNWKKGKTPEIEPITGPIGPDGKPLKPRPKTRDKAKDEGKAPSKIAQAQAKFMQMFSKS